MFPQHLQHSHLNQSDRVISGNQKARKVVRVFHALDGTLGATFSHNNGSHGTQQRHALLEQKARQQRPNGGCISGLWPSKQRQCPPHDSHIRLQQHARRHLHQRAPEASGTHSPTFSQTPTLRWHNGVSGKLAACNERPCAQPCSLLCGDSGRSWTRRYEASPSE